MTTSESSSRFLELEGIYNFRDIGGYPTQDGRLTRWKTIYRSDSLQNLTPAGEKALLDAGLRTIIDLRRQDEVEAEPDVLMNSPSVQFFNLPVFQNPSSSANMQAFAAIENLRDLYSTILDPFQDRLHAVSQLITHST